MKLELKQNIGGYCVAVGAAIEIRNDPVIEGELLPVNIASFLNTDTNHVESEWTGNQS